MRAYIGFPDYMLNSTRISQIFKQFEDVSNEYNFDVNCGVIDERLSKDVIFLYQFTIRSETYFKNQVSISENGQQRKLKNFRKSKDNTL